MALAPTVVTTSQKEPGETPPISQVMLISDELLVAHAAAPTVQSYLDSHSIKFARLTTLLSGLQKVPAAALPYDVEVWRLLPSHPPVIKLAPLLWSGPLAGNERAVTPNHVLIPASWADSCPFGPPAPMTSGAGSLRHPEGAHGMPVTVIDAGYQWDTRRWHAHNPLNDFANVTRTQGQHPKPLNAGGPLVATTGDIRSAPFQATWLDDRVDVPDANGDKRLDALAGHGNFVMGVLGQYASLPNISLWNHYGGFYPDPDEYLRELSVCRSLIHSHLTHPTSLINLGFSFVPLKQPGKDHVLSLAWDTVFRVLGTNPDKLRMITPAGNQGSTVRHYPAALNELYKGRYPNVMGVASHDDGKQTPSVDSSGAPWSNSGSWVAASAIGSDVLSTFLHVKMKTEDDAYPFPVRDFTATNIAQWNGTCFAAPKITGSLAEQYAVVGSLNQAWQNILNTTNHFNTADMGIVLPF